MRLSRRLCCCPIKWLILPYMTSPPPLQDGLTPLHVAAMYGYASIIALLLATPGADPLARDKVGRGDARSAQGLDYLPACPLHVRTPSCSEAKPRWNRQKAKARTPQPRCCRRTRASQRRSQQ